MKTQSKKVKESRCYNIHNIKIALGVKIMKKDKEK